MGLIEAIILGIIQGLTEFLPVSSSGHLELAKALFDQNLDPEKSMLFTVVVHLATVLSTIVVFRKELMEIIRGLLQFKWNEEFQFALKIVLSMIPAAFIGVVFNDEIEAFFDGKVVFVGAMLLLTGVLLFLADKAKNTNKKVSFLDAVIIGVAQAIAILPGISRSGATISTSVLLGIDRERAARFSFLMVIPLILGKVAKDILDNHFVMQTDTQLPYIVGFIAAFVTGIAACTWMIELVKKAKFMYFAIYCFVIGGAAIFWGML